MTEAGTLDLEDHQMNLVLPLTESESAKLLAKAQAEGTTPESIVRRAIEPIIDPEAGGSLEAPPHQPEPTTSLFGILSKYGPAPTDAEIDENRREMFGGFGRDDIL